MPYTFFVDTFNLRYIEAQAILKSYIPVLHPQPDATFQNETYIGLIFISRRNWQPDELIYTIVMNKILANIAYYGCFVIALIVSYLTLNYAGDLAYSGQQPLVWLSVLAFFAVVTLVVLAIIIKAKFKI